MSVPREREQRFAEIQRALDESDREERMEEDRDIEAMAQKWEKLVKQYESFRGS